ncbi:gamma-glutamyl-gamma-aminobutyrate hydrolase family protein [Pleionea litopenaei]|uniref:Type 1 glutamine amidotransferase n=1 Tax=Pleionea litopenaei TaxID=3070815 RepID=A0AA51RSB6_9GAMM|nr:type 1 glutamine amidotransferase [Pleionea sp. HL-JVS1]WMS86742.1 type 1 glutamine amidotransferase [Pleionea sp. HL-JVS1]
MTRINHSSPLIVVTGPNKRWPIGWWAIRFMLWLNNMKAIYCAPNGHPIPEQFDGVVISGGDDIHPQLYGDVENARSRYDPERDELEIKVLKKALRDQLPILGICRGSQLLNIVAKGSLYSDIRPMRKLTPNQYVPWPVKEVKVTNDSQLGQCVAPKVLAVNSLHHQAIKNLGDDLVVTARDADGFIQAIEHRDKFIVGVQWHPEYLPYLASQRNIFRCFSQAVKRVKSSLENS